MMSLYRLYIDESGTNSPKSIDDMNNFLTLAGVIIEKDNYLKIAYELNKLKNDLFDYDLDNNNIILHKEDIYNSRKGFEKLRDPDYREKFNQSLLNFLKRIDFTLIAVMINKKSRCNKKGLETCDHYEIGLETLLKRYVMFLQENNSRGDVLLEARDKGQDKFVKNRYKHIYENGTRKTGNVIDLKPQVYQKFLSSKEIKIKPKNNNIIGTQIADILVSPMRNWMLNNYENIQNKNSYNFSKKLFDTIKNKIRSKYNPVTGNIEIERYGVIYIK